MGKRVFLAFVMFSSMILFADTEITTKNVIEMSIERGYELPFKFSSHAFTLYNTLPEVELADQTLQESQNFDQFLAEAQELARNHNLEKKMGLRLIHAHTRIKPDEIMVEKEEKFEGEDALVTRPQDKMQENKAAPASWIFDGKEYHVFEYSCDPHVLSAVKELKNDHAFLNAFAILLKKYRYENLVALAVTDREWHQHHAGKHSFLEQSYKEPTFASVIKVCDEHENLRAIITSWSFKQDPITHYCAIHIKCTSTAKWGHIKQREHNYVV